MILAPLSVAEELKVVKAAHQGWLQPSAVEAKLREHDSAHQAELKSRQDEISRLKDELAKARAEKATVENEERRLRAEEQKTAEETEQRANSVEKQLDQLKTKPAQWLSELRWIDQQLSRKFILYLVISRLPGVSY